MKLLQSRYKNCLILQFSLFCEIPIYDFRHSFPQCVINSYFHIAQPLTDANSFLTRNESIERSCCRLYFKNVLANFKNPPTIFCLRHAEWLPVAEHIERWFEKKVVVLVPVNPSIVSTGSGSLANNKMAINEDGVCE